MQFNTNETPVMSDAVRHLYTGMNQELQELATQFSDDIIQLSSHAVKSIRATLGTLKDHVVNLDFPDQQQEIYFFKHVKPLFLSKLVCYVNLYRISSEIPKALPASEQKYLKKELQQLDNFYENHRDFCAYYRSNATHLDKEYFIRGHINLHSSRNSAMFSMDTSFATTHDHLVSELLAADMMGPVLTNMINESGLQGVHNEKTSPSLPSTADSFAQTNFRASEVYVFLKSLIDSQAITNHSYKSFFEMVVPKIGTRLNKSLNPGSLLKYSDKVDPETRENVKRLLMKMIRNIENY